MNTLIKTIVAAAALAGSCAGFAETIFEAKGPVTDQTPGFRFGNITFTDNDRVCAKFTSVPMGESANGRLTTQRLKLPHSLATPRIGLVKFVGRTRLTQYNSPFGDVVRAWGVWYNVRHET